MLYNYESKTNMLSAPIFEHISFKTQQEIVNPVCFLGNLAHKGKKRFILTSRGMRKGHFLESELSPSEVTSQ